MAIDKLTASVVKAATFDSKPDKLYGRGGLYLHVKPVGKYWRLKHRLNGREKLLAIGPYTDFLLRETRERGDEARKQLREGVDPFAHKHSSFLKGRSDLIVVPEAAVDRLSDADRSPSGSVALRAVNTLSNNAPKAQMHR